LNRSTIKFTSSHSSTNVPFLDVSVFLTNNDGSISTDLYTKPTDKHQHLLYSSCHLLHTKTAIPFSLALRLRRICSTDAKFNTRAAQLTTYLLKRVTTVTSSPNKYDEPPTSPADCDCATCPYISHGLTTYTFFSTGETHPIKCNLTCETENLIYMNQCNRCILQYIGETKRRLKD